MNYTILNFKFNTIFSDNNCSRKLKTSVDPAANIYSTEMIVEVQTNVLMSVHCPFLNLYW